MATRRLLVSAAFLLLLGSTQRSTAAPITFAYTGTVDGSDLPGAAAIGDPVSGTFTFESTTADTDPLPHLGGYRAITVGSFQFGSYAGTIGPTAGTNASISVVDFTCCDSYSAWDVTPVGPLVHQAGFDFELVKLELYLEDITGAVFSSVALPTTPPPLSSFDFGYVELRFVPTSFPSSYAIIASVDSLTLGPEPTGELLLLAAGGILAAMRRRARALGAT
jgi:hypothetical protein